MWSQLLDYKPPNSKHQHPEYDAFLNFWGEDTYNNVTNYLYYTLKDHELIPFKDNKEVMMGEPISKILLDAIKKSRMGRTAIIIFFKVFHVVLGRICV